MLYDGWPAVRAPNSPAALHLFALLSILPEQIEAVLALPQEPPEWLPDRVETYVESKQNTIKARLHWEQIVLPELKVQLEAHLLHITSPNPAMFRTPPTLVSPAGYAGSPTFGQGFFARLRSAVSKGGMARAKLILWPNDLPIISNGGQYHYLPPIVHPDFTPKEHFYPLQLPQLDIPDHFILYHGPFHPFVLRRALEAWTFPAGPIGEVYPLVLLGLDENARDYILPLVEEFNIKGTVTMLPAIPPPLLPAIYQKASAVFHPANTSIWGGPMRHALACGKPLVSIETPMNSKLVGSAAYLSQPDDIRGLGAGLISVIVREDVKKQLQESALDVSHHWGSPKITAEKLVDIYSKVAQPG